MLRDATMVTEVDQPRRLVLHARMMPFPVHRVAFEVDPRDGGTVLTIDGRPFRGPSFRIWNPLLDALLGVRNVFVLRRIRKLVE